MSHQRILCSVLEHNSGENLKMTEGCISAGENQCAERGLSNSPMRVFSYAPVFIIGGNQRIVVKCWFSCKRNTVSFVFLKSICTRKFGVCVCTFLFYVILQLMSVGTKFGGGKVKKFSDQTFYGCVLDKVALTERPEMGTVYLKTY